MKTSILLFVFAFFTVSSLQAQWTSSSNTTYTNDNVGIGISIGTTTLQNPFTVAGVDGIRLIGTSNQNSWMLLQPEVSVNGLNPGTSTMGARITNRYFGHLVVDILANDSEDAFAIRTDSDHDGTVDNIALVVKPSGYVGLGTKSPVSNLTVKEVFESVGGSAPESIVTFKKEFNHVGGHGSTGRTTDVLHLEMNGGASIENHFLECSNGSTVVASIDGAGNGKFNRLKAEYLNVENWEWDAENMTIASYIKHKDDANTYFGFPANDQFVIRTQGTDRFKIINGKIGIGTNYPTAKVEVRHSASSGNPHLELVEESDNGVARLYMRNGGSNSDRYFSIGGNPGSGNPYMNFTFNNGSGSTRIMRIDGVNQAVGIGNNIGEIPAGYKLAVDGNIKCREVRVTNSGWADFVFEEDYQLPDLEEVEKYIQNNKHLPDVPSAQDVMENGTDLGEIDAILLQKIEELTLYVIDLKKEITVLKTEKDHQNKN